MGAHARSVCCSLQSWTSGFLKIWDAAAQDASVGLRVLVIVQDSLDRGKEHYEKRYDEGAIIQARSVATFPPGTVMWGSAAGSADINTKLFACAGSRRPIFEIGESSR